MRRLLILVGAIVFVDTLFFAALTPLLPHYVDELGLSKAHAGLLAARLSDRHLRRRAAGRDRDRAARGQAARR